MKGFLPIFFCFFSLAVFSQNFSYSTSEIITSEKRVSIKPWQITRDFKPALVNLEMPSPSGNSYQSFLLRQKELISTPAPRKTGSTVVLGNAENPFVLNGFEGNEFDGSVPTDNHLAVSNDGMLISVANSTIYMYDTEADSLLVTVSLEAFFDTLQLPANKYDPRVVYDMKQNRFIIACLSGSTDSTSNLVLAFSSSAHPGDEWHLYSLPGNPLNDSSWSDYPIIAITDDELFITVNKLHNDTLNALDSWKYLFRESLIWQISKQSGYDGNTLVMRYYNDIKYDGLPIRNLCPIQGGSATYGPDIYLLSNKNFALQNDTFFILRVTGLLDDPGTYLQMSIHTSNVSYGLAPDGKQRFNRILLTNDSRVLGGYLEDDQIHFVQNTVNPDSSRAAVYHGIISNVSGTKDIHGGIIGVDSLDFAYANISYTGKYPGDDEALITFNHTSVDTFAGFSAVFYDSHSGYSERVTLKPGTDFAAPLPGIRQRWGDYSGSQRKYDEAGKVWAAGFFAERSGVQRINSTWISELQSPDTASQPPVAVKPVRKIQPEAFPNPASRFISLDFELDGDRFLAIELFDAAGKPVKTFIRDRVKSGKNRFSFSVEPLNAGVYFLRITDGREIILNEKIIKQE
ncbi:MAG TPA: T9SS type A sorting domain-containing protein [Chitinophagales bacterium]|nr:T9SS type A sorting domain-containing protein [Chitinophagales bacterium]